MYQPQPGWAPSDPITYSSPGAYPPNPSPFASIPMPTPEQMREIDRDGRIYKSITDEIRHRDKYIDGRIRALQVSVALEAIAIILLVLFK